MVKKLSLLIAAFGGTLSAPGGVSAESPASTAGRTVAEFGAGAGEAIGARIGNAIWEMQPQWITIAPRSKKECLAQTGGEMNAMFVRCRNGWQEYVRYDRQGAKVVLSERAIPAR